MESLIQNNKNKLKQKHIFISDLIKNNTQNNEKSSFKNVNSNSDMAELNISGIDDDKILKNSVLQVDNKLHNQVTLYYVYGMV